MNTFTSPTLWLACTVASATLCGCGGGGGSMSTGSGICTPSYAMSCPGTTSSTGTGTSYSVTNLASDTSGSAAHLDTNLVNGWGLALNPLGFAWVADAGTSKSTLYDGNGLLQSPVVSIPAGLAGPGLPTGIVFNPSTDFVITQGSISAPSMFLFVGLSGTLSAWSPSVNASNAITVFDGGATRKVYTGLALAQQGGANFLYATDFRNGTVDVFDKNFAPVTMPGTFTDPALPAGYMPFGIQAIDGNVYVSFAKHDPVTGRSLASSGVGAVDVFDPAGHLLKQLVQVGGVLNAPWGMVMTPANFGPFSNSLLVGNFGDGKIYAFNPSTGAAMGPLNKSDGTPVVVDGLWGLAFGNGINSLPTNTLFFAAGPAGETHGVFGRIDNL